jgi:hypothetical protein
MLCTIAPSRVKPFQRQWRRIATAAGIPSKIQNRDSRAGAATEADLAGAQKKLGLRSASLEHRTNTFANKTRGSLSQVSKINKVDDNTGTCHIGT